MSRRIIIPILFFSLLSQIVLVDDLNANTAEERLIEVEKQLQAVANQIKQYEGEKTNLEKNILANDSALNQVNRELAEVQTRLVKAEQELDEALAGYDQSLENLAAVQQNIIQEQTKLGKIKNEITDVKEDLFETQKSLNIAKEDLQEQAVELYINGVMSPSTALFIDLNELSDFLAALGYASSIVDSAYEIVEQLNAFERLSETQTEFLTVREEERETSITNLQEEEEKKNEISIEAEEFADDVETKKNIVESEKQQVENKKARVLTERRNAQNLLNQANKQLEKLDKEHADLEKLEDAIQADIDRLMSVGGVAPGKLSWPITGSYVSSGYKWRRLGGTTSFHGAIDIPSNTGTPIKAAAGGVVIVARYYGAAGRTVFIDHGGGMTTLYFHMNKIYVSVGQTVVTGDTIGSVGTTGRTTGPHLHFEVRLKNPSSVECSLPYLDPTSRGRMNPYCFLDWVMKVFAQNTKAKNSYEFLEYFEAGIVLTGAETKSIRNGGVSIIDAFASIENEEAILREMNIEAYKYADVTDYDPKAPRKMLLHKKEIKRLIGLTSTKGNTLIATKVFEKNGFIKVEVALAKGKKDYDKRKKIDDRRVSKEIRDYK